MTATARVVVTRDELAEALAPLRERGPVALVPTMGALHAGHASLVEQAAGAAPSTVVSVFVNPLQFAAGEDLDRYPRALDADVDLCTQRGAALVWAPRPQDVYPDPVQVTVSAGEAGQVLEGAARPGHFDGVLTVVAKLFGLVRPDIAVFGRKDAQQLALVRKMVRDLDLGVQLLAGDTVREVDGLAMSSRNAYLSPAQRAAAAVLFRALSHAREHAGADLTSALAAARQLVAAETEVDLDYLEAVDPQTLRAWVPGSGGHVMLVIAARLGTTRLIDTVDTTI